MHDYCQTNHNILEHTIGGIWVFFVRTVNILLIHIFIHIRRGYGNYVVLHHANVFIVEGNMDIYEV